MSSNPSDDARQLASGLLMIIVAVGAGLGVWLWASTAPELAIGEDIPAFAVLGGISVFLAALGIMGLIRFRWLMDTDSQGGAESSHDDTMAADSGGGHNDISNKEDSINGVESADRESTTSEVETPDPVEAGSTDDSNEDLGTANDLIDNVNRAQLETGLAIEDPNGNETVGGESPNPNRPADSNQSAGRTQQPTREGIDSHNGARLDDVEDGSTIEPEPREKRSDNTAENGEITPAPREQAQQWLTELVE